MFAVPREQVVRIHASSGTTGKPTVVGYTQNDIDTWANLVARSIRAAGGRAGDIVHVAYGYGLFTGGLGAHYGAERLGCTVIPMSGGQTEKQVQLIQRLRARHHHGHAELHAGDHRGVRAPGHRPASRWRCKVGIFGAEPWTEAMRRDIEARAGDRRGRHLRPVRSDGPGRRQRVHRDQGRPGDLGRPLLPRDHRPRDRRGAARRRRGRAGLHLADQGSAADDPLPHARPHAPAAAHRARDAPHGQDHRPQRRHADHPRRQRVPDADRGADPAARHAVGAVPDRRQPRRHARRGAGAVRAAARRAPSADRARDRQRAAAAHQDAGRHHHHGERVRARIDRTHAGRQGPPRDRQAAR